MAIAPLPLTVGPPPPVGGAANDLAHWLHRVKDGLWSSFPTDGTADWSGIWVITGATGGLGRLLATHLAARGARLLLTGRRPDPGPLPEGAVYVAADLGTRRGAALVVRAARRLAGAAPVGLLHLAGVVGPEAMAAKRDGLLFLRDSLAAAELSRGPQILFSSLSGVVPGLDRGLEVYAAANRWLDAFALERAAAGERVQSISWPAWEQVGMAAERAEEFKAAGLPTLDPSRGLALLDAAVGTGAAHVVVMHRPPAVAGAVPVDLADRVRRAIAEAAGLTVDKLGDEVPLARLGIDSVMAMELVRSLEELTGRHLPSTLLFEHDRVSSLLRFLAGNERALAPSVAPAPSRSDATPLLPSQLAFLAQQAFFPDLPANVFLSLDATRAGAPGLDRGNLEAALALLVTQHPILRGRVEDRALHLDGAQPLVLWGEINEQAELNRPFDLALGPMLRVLSDGRRLVLHAPHLGVDAWSLGVLARTLLETHESLGAGDSIALPPGPSWPELAAALRALPVDDAWWAQRFADGLPPLHLPLDGPAGLPTVGPAGVVVHRLEVATTAALQARCRSADLTLPALTLAAWLAVMWRHSGQHDLVVRLAHGRRDLRVAGVERAVGNLAESLPFRLRLRPGEGLVALAVRARVELAEIIGRSGASAAGLAGIGIRGAAGPTGLSPAGFSFPPELAPDRIGGLLLDQIVGATVSGFTRASLVAWVHGGRLHQAWSHANGHVRAERAQAWADELAALLEAVAEGDDPIPLPTPGGRRLHREVLAVCARQPEARAVVDSDGRVLTYAGLDRASAALAGRLGPCRRVAVLAAPSADAVTALLAALRTGGAYLPLDPAWPDARIAEILALAEPERLLTPAALAPRARALHPRVEVVDAFGGEEGAAPEAEGELAYLMFTSGTTGRPKGVIVSHADSLAFLAWCTRVLDLSPADRLIQTSSLGFGGSIRQIWGSLLAGAEIHPAPLGLTRDPEALLAFLDQRRISVWNSVPSLWAFLMDALERAERAPPEALRWVLLGGEAVPAAHARRWRRCFGPRIRLANLYGSTETLHNATWHEVVEAPPEEGPALLPIGRARAGVEVELQGADGAPAAEGEIVVLGAVATGYLGGSEADAARFGEERGRRVFHTGDLGRRLPDGSLLYLGRQDGQVQIHGNRVELGEVEAVLVGCVGVAHALATWDGRQLVGWVEPRLGGAIEAEAVRAWAAARLPGPAVPHRVVVLSQLPRSAAGKLDRRALEERPAPASERAASSAEPTNLVLARAWTAVLGVSPREDSDFFADGGDSILLLELLDRLRGATPALPPALQLYQARRFGRMAELLAAAHPEEAAPSLPWAQPLPLSRVQRGFWLLDRGGAGSPGVLAMVPLRGPVQVGALQRAIGWLFERHPILRVRVWIDRGRPVQQPVAGAVPWLQLDDLLGQPADLQAATLQRRWEEEAAAPLNLDCPPAVRLRLIRLGEGEHRLLLSAHHLVADAWSAWVLARELVLAHDSFAAGRAPALPPAPGFQALIADPPASAADRAWWRAALADLSQEAAPPRDRLQEGEATLSPGAWSSLQRRSHELAVSPFVLVLGALGGALQAALGQREILIATATSGREGRGDGVVGPLASGLPLRLRDISPAAVAQTLAAALAHAPAPPELLAELIGPELLARLGRFFLTWLDPAAVAPAVGSLHLAWEEARLRFATETTHAELNLGVLVGAGLRLNWQGGPRAPGLVADLIARLEESAGVDAGLVVYAPDEIAGLVDLGSLSPLRVEVVEACAGRTELVLLPLRAGDLTATADLDARVGAAVGACEARVVALAGMLPALTGLGLRALPGTRSDQVVTTGHAATVVAMLLTVRRILAETGRTWGALAVGVLGYGAIGRAVIELCTHVLGPPLSLRIADPRLGHPDLELAGCGLILGATSGGPGLEVSALDPGTLVVDDSFPRAFNDAAALARMRDRADVLLVGGGMLDLGPLARRSPFEGAPALRARFGGAWLPGCHAEALLVAIQPALGPTRGPVQLERALAVLSAIEALGWQAPPLHLGGTVLPATLAAGLRR